MDRRKVVLKSHRATDVLSMADSGYRHAVITFMNSLLDSDSLDAGDVSTDAILDRELKVISTLTLHESCVVAGVAEVRAFLEGLTHGGDFVITNAVKDGQRLPSGSDILVFESTIANALLVERTILNILQRMSAVATKTAELTATLPDSVLLCPTRKTLLPLMDKRACILGGGGSHRLSLSDAILVKDNHLAALHYDWNSVFRLLVHFSSVNQRPLRFVEVEVESVPAALECVEAGRDFILGSADMYPFYILLDNMTPSHVKKAVSSISERFSDIPVYFEASGGITEKSLPEYGKTGVDVISMGSLTHSAAAVDISMSVSPL